MRLPSDFVPVPFRLLRDALWQLSLEPSEQRMALEGSAITDELALDLDNAVASLQHASEAAGKVLDPDVLEAVRALNAAFGMHGPEDEMWVDAALDRHAVWAQARKTARALLPRLPADA